MKAKTPVRNAYDAMRGKGYPKAKAARIAQSATGLSLQTGKPPMNKEAARRAAKRFHDREHDEASVTA